MLSSGPTLATKALISQLQVPTPSIGDTIEICPEAWRISLQLANLISKNSGACLFVDYGEDYILRDSLRVLKKKNLWT